MHTVVLGAGGPVGGAWLGGLVGALLDGGVAINAAHQILGTSAGSVLGAWLASGADPAGFVDAMEDRARWHESRRGSPAPDRLEEAAAGALWSRWLPTEHWPDALRVTAVGHHSGRVTVWSAADRVPLPAAVAASTAAPGVVPPIQVAGRVYVDGAVRSPTNADLAATGISIDGTDVLVLAPVVSPRLRLETDLLRALGCSVSVIRPEAGELGGAFEAGSNTVLGPALIRPASQSGRNRALRALDDLLLASTVGKKP
jgi:NTE family protein